MTPEYLGVLILGVTVVAFLYSSGGHAGASGYIAVVSLLSVAPAAIKPAALTLNILVASISTWQFWRAGHSSWRLFWPLALLSVPLAFLSGYINLRTHIFNVMVGVILLYSAARFLLRPPAEQDPIEPPRLLAISFGGGIGLLSGLTGTGGGIFLTPLLLFMHWVKAKPAAAVSALLFWSTPSQGFSAISATPSSFQLSRCAGSPPVLALPSAHTLVAVTLTRW